MAGFEPVALVEVDQKACQTLRHNKPNWNVVEADLRQFDASQYAGVDLLCAGLPCPPFSIAGKRLGENDERNLFPSLIRIVRETRPRAIMIENVKGFLSQSFSDYRTSIEIELIKLGYGIDWKLLNSSEFGVSQSRNRAVGIAMPFKELEKFSWPQPTSKSPKTVGKLLKEQMGANGWIGLDDWVQKADEIAPTIVGGSKKHGGPDLGPTGAKKAWAKLSVDGKGVANQPPQRDFIGMPKLTVEMVAKIQGFPENWKFQGRKTHTYRQVGNAFPPPVAKAVAVQIKETLLSTADKKAA
jgi:DNA (cytosine-5)-methyltransferase 1